MQHNDLAGQLPRLSESWQVPQVWRFPLLQLTLAWSCLAMVFRAEWTAMASQWWDISTYNHILLIPLIIVWLVWQRLGQLDKFSLQGGRAQNMENIAKQLEMDRTHGVYFCTAGIELDLLLHDAAAHVFDHCGVFPTQATQLDHLLGKIPAANVQRATRLVFQFCDTCRDRRSQNFLALPHDTLRQSVLKFRQLACL